MKTIIGGNIDHIHLQQFTHHRAVFEESLEATVVIVRFTRIGGQELAPLVDFIADSRDLVLVTAGSQKIKIFAGVMFLCRSPST